MSQLCRFRTEVITDEDFDPCLVTAETLPHDTQFNGQRKEIWSISQRDYGPTQDQEKMTMRQVLQLPTKSPGNEERTDVLRKLFLSWHLPLILSSKMKQKKNKNGSSFHLHYLKLTYIMARTLIRMVCPPKFREGFNIILFVLAI